MQIGSTGTKQLWRITMLSAFAVSLASAAAGAQSPTKSAGGRTLLTLNPLGLPLEYFAAELENKVSDLVTLGTSFSWLGASDDNYLSLEAKLRVYPNEKAFRGFSLGLGVGATRTEEESTDFSGNTVTDKRTRPSVGVFTDYNWLLGKRDRFVVGAGVGVKRLLGEANSNDFFDIPDVYPTARFQVGWIF